VKKPFLEKSISNTVHVEQRIVAVGSLNSCQKLFFLVAFWERLKNIAERRKGSRAKDMNLLNGNGQRLLKAASMPW
jgi:predicted DNA-binding ribbon-helix-helix protein